MHLDNVINTAKDLETYKNQKKFSCMWQIALNYILF